MINKVLIFFNIKFEEWEKEYYIFSLLLFSIVLFILPDRCHGDDMGCWRNWASYTYEHGLVNVYNSGTDYLPLYHYILWGFGAMKESVDQIAADIKYIKLITFLFHLVNGFIFIKLIRCINQQGDIRQSIFYVLNASVLYNTLLWGQVDEIMTCFVFVSIYFALSKRTILSSISLLLAINFKLQAIIYLPIVFLILLPSYYTEPKKIIRTLAILFLIQFFIFLPFILAGTLPQVIYILTHLVDSQPFISANAFNIWHFFYYGHTFDRDTQIVGFLSLKQWGLLMFFGLSFLALLPLVITNYRIIVQKNKEDINARIVLIISGLVPLLFFYFCTQMHERYCHPAIIFLVAYSVVSRKYIFGLLGSIAYLLNLDAVLKGLSFQNYGVVLYNSRFISILFLLTIVLLYHELWKNYKITQSRYSS